METRIKEVYEVLGFKIAYVSKLEGKEIIEANYYILNHAGEVVSREYQNVLEPLNILLTVKKQLSEKSLTENQAEILSLYKKENPAMQGMTGDEEEEDMVEEEYYSRSKSFF